MGEFRKASVAYMIPIQDGKVMEDNPREPTLNIYKIPVDKVQVFIEKYSNLGVSWAPLYRMQDGMDYNFSEVDSPDEV